MPSFTSCKHTKCTRRPLFSRRLISLSITSVVLTGWMVCGVLMGPVKNAEAKAGQGEKSTAENQKLWDELDEIDRMRSLGPLKLTSEQIDKIIPLLEKANKEYDQNLNDLSTNTIGQIAADIHTEHKDALSGAPIPKEFDTKVEEKLNNFYERRQALMKQNSKHMSEAFQKILTEDQQKLMIKLGKDYLAKIGTKPGPNDTDDTFYNRSITDVFLMYPHIVALLKESKASGK